LSIKAYINTFAIQTKSLMPKTSQRSQSVPLSPFRKLIPIAEQAKEKGKKVYHLNIGQPDIITPKKPIEKLRQTPLKILEYSPADGHESYRKALVDYYQRFDVKLDVANISVTTGGSEAILFFMLTCLDPGDEIIVLEPFYANYNGFAHIAGVHLKAVTTYIEDGFAMPSLAAIADKVTAKTKAILITNPNNPTGTCYSKKELAALAEIVKERDLFLCVDEVYREFCFDGNTFFSALNLTSISENVVVIDSVSKRYSACGIRVGTMVTRNREVTEMVGRYARLRLSPPALGQFLAEYLLDDDTLYLETVKKEYDNRRQLVYDRLKKMNDVDAYLPGGAFYCFARLPIASAEDFCRWLLTDFDYEGATVMLSPGEGFYATPGLGKSEIRIAYVLNTTDLDAAMDCLEVALSEYVKNKEAISLLSKAL